MEYLEFIKNTINKTNPQRIEIETDVKNRVITFKPINNFIFKSSKTKNEITIETVKKESSAFDNESSMSEFELQDAYTILNRISCSETEIKIQLIRKENIE